MAKSPTLLFCVGATKASTSWLFRYLSGHPDCHLQKSKELHFFDNLDAAPQLARVTLLQSELDALRAEYQAAPRSVLAARIASADTLIEVLKSGNTQSYLDYLTKNIGQKHLIADITPAYALLPIDRLRTMAALLPDVRFVYVLRDPVARLWSHVRMSAYQRGGDFMVQAAQVFDAVMAGTQSGLLNRGDYKSALQRLDAAVDPSRLLVMFQEVLLTVPGIQRLCAFLGITQHDANFADRVHVGPQLAITDNQKLRAQQILRPQYQFVANRFGQLPEAWLRNMGEGVA